jgi:hypothetical protein
MKKGPTMRTLELRNMGVSAGQEREENHQPLAGGPTGQTNSLKGEAPGLDDPGFVLNVQPFG